MGLIILYLSHSHLPGAVTTVGQFGSHWGAGAGLKGLLRFPTQFMWTAPADGNEKADFLVTGVSFLGLGSTCNGPDPARPSSWHKLVLLHLKAISQVL